MSICVGKYQFEGPGLTPKDLQEKPGLYILLQCLPDDSYELLDLGHFQNLYTSWNSVGFDHFEQCHSGAVSLAVLYDCDGNGEGRSAIVKEILAEFGYPPTCAVLKVDSAK